MSATQKLTSLVLLAVAVTATLGLPAAGSSISDRTHQQIGRYGGGYGGGFPNSGSSGGSGGSGDSDSSSGSYSGFSSAFGNGVHYRSIHGILSSVAMVVLFPIGSILMRLVPGRLAIWFHAFTQVLALLLFVAGAALGIYLVRAVHVSYGGGSLLTNSDLNYHPIIGIVCLATLVLQPILGFIHHARFKQLGRRTAWSHLHLWNGRLFVTLGIINGGLGLKLAGSPRNTKVAYAVVAAIIWLLWCIIAVFSMLRRSSSNNTKGVNNAAIASAAAVPNTRTGVNRRHRQSRNSGPPMATASNPLAQSSRSSRSTRSSSGRRGHITTWT